MMRPLTEEAYYTELQPIEQQLISVQNFDAGLLEYFFNDHLPDRRIIYPCDPVLDDDLILTLIDGMRSVQDSGLYIDLQGVVTYSTRDGVLATTPSSYYYIPIDQVEYALGNEGIAKTFMAKEKPFLFFSDFVLYSPQGKWVFALNVLGHHALLGGAAEFISRLEPKHSRLNDRTLDFLANWKHRYWFNINELDKLDAYYDWIARLLFHVYGREKSIDLLRESGLLVD